MVMIGVLVFYYLMWTAMWKLVLKRIPVPKYVSIAAMALFILVTILWPFWQENRAAKEFNEKTCVAEAGVKVFHKLDSVDGMTFEGPFFSENDIRGFINSGYFNYAEISNSAYKNHFQMVNGYLVVSPDLKGSDIHFKNDRHRVNDGIIYDDYVVYNKTNGDVISLLRIPVFLGGFISTHFTPRTLSQFCSGHVNSYFEWKRLVEDTFKK